ncbi:MAG TPA: right-handed parallel beta-helix repeat-containing protein [Chthonomonadaceae bacterium]|nr:right-handed parallel beta-helix repeat-containing protein [Chthonomonadaceae bacterium]
MKRLLMETIVLLTGGILMAVPARATQWYVAPDGTPTGQGTKGSPWDIISALNGAHKVAPGDTIWLQAGTYKYPFGTHGSGYEVKLVGTKEAPIQIRGVPGQRVTLDGGLALLPPTTYVWVRDLEILVSEPRPRDPVPAELSNVAAGYRGVNRPWGGVTGQSGHDCRFINLVIHDNNQGMGWWATTDGEAYGCILYDNGWQGTDRGHGHAIYTQNREGRKIISDCIMTGGYGYSLHAYGSWQAYVDNYYVEGNIVYNANEFLLGGGNPSHNIHVVGNYLYNVPRMRLGYDAPYNEDCEVRNNIIVNGKLAINNYRKVVNAGNLILAKAEPRPRGSKVILRPNKYDSDRANLAIYNWDKAPVVPVKAGSFLRKGEAYRLMDPRDFYGKPIAEGVYDGKALPAPVKGEFAAFVLLKRPARASLRGRS